VEPDLNRRFADSHRADHLALDQLDIVETPEQPSEEGSGHPSRSSPTNDQDLSHRAVD